MPKHYIFAIILSLLFSTSLLAATGPLPDDPNLDKPVTLAIKGEALSDIAEMLGKQSGAELRVTKEIADQKATIFVDAKPLRDVMLALETLFGFRWSVKTVNGKQVYELWMTEKTRKEREAGWNAALSKAWDDADAQIKLVAELSTKTQEELMKLNKAWDDQEAQNKRIAELSTKSQEELQKMMAEQYMEPANIALLNALSRGKPMGSGGMIARFYTTLPQHIKDALRAGCSIHYNTDSLEQEWHVPDEIARQQEELHNKPENYDSQNSLQTDSINMELSPQITKQGVSITYTVKNIYRKGDSLSGGGGILCEEMPIVEPSASVVDRLPHAPVDPVLKEETTFTAEELMSEAAIPRQQKTSSWIYATMSDVLTLLHRKLGLQIISDHYSDWTWGDNANSNPTEKRLDQAKVHNPSYCWGWDGTYLYVRAAEPRHMDVREIPNRILKPLQDVFKRQGWLGIDELAQIASLSKEQIESLDGNARFLGLSTYNNRIIDYPSSYWVFTLRFYNTLTSNQRKQIVKNGIPVVSLNPSQRSALSECLMSDGLSMSGRYSKPVGIWKNGIRIDKPYVSRPSDPISVAFQQDEKDIYTYKVNNSSESFQGFSVDAARERILKSNPEAKKGNGKLYQQAGYKMVITFGDGRQSSISIPIEIPLSMN